MFVCPECGWRLPPCWRAHKYFLYAFYCRFDEFKKFYPEDIVKELLRKKDIEYGSYTFHLTGPRKPWNIRYVIMILTELKVFIYDRTLIERYKAQKKDESQLVLEQFMEESL